MDDNTEVFNFTRGNKFFELSNHLGNVMATVSDRKASVDTNNNGLVDYYQADVVAANDYYPFGMIMPGRKYSVGSGYRYGFNGQEKAPEINDNGYTAEFWRYDSRIGRRWNTDPLPKIYESPYAAFANNPINYIDPTGADTINITRTTTRRVGGNMGGGLDGVAPINIPDQISRTTSVAVRSAKGNDIFQITDVNVKIDASGNETGISTTTTLNLNNEQTFYRTGGHSMKGYIDDRHALAANAPTWL